MRDTDRLGSTRQGNPLVGELRIVTAAVECYGRAGLDVARRGATKQVKTRALLEHGGGSANRQVGVALGWFWFGGVRQGRAQFKKGHIHGRSETWYSGEIARHVDS